MLPGIIAIHDIEDLELLVREALRAWMGRRGAWLVDHEFEDLLQHCLCASWEAAAGWETGRGWSASKLAFSRTQLRAVDWYRRRFGDSRAHGPRVQPLSLDAITAAYAAGGDDDDGRTSLDALASRPEDGPEARATAGLGLRD
jgi:hypothetical protein